MQQHRLSDVTLLVRFRDSHDTQSLASLFDRYALPLWKRARAQTSECDADDLVQSTFVSVIESAKSFDESYAVRPWLFGILANHIRMRARADQQRRMDEERLRDRRVEDEAAASVVSVAEVRERLARAVEELPAPYREVVSARFEAEDPTCVIAAKLGRERGTVRKQIHRGLHLLRKALPIEIAMGVLLALSPRRLLAGVRSGAPTRALTAGSFVATACLFVLAAWAVGLGAPSGAALEAPVDGARAHALASPALDDDASGLSVRRASEPDAPGRAAVRAAGIGLRYRNGSTAAGLSMGLLPRVGGSLVEQQLHPARHTLVADAQGRLDLSSVPAGQYVLMPMGGLPRASIRVYEDGSASRARMRVAARRRVVGRVLDGERRALPGARVYVSATQGRGDAPDLIGVSDAEGKFDVLVACEQPWLWAAADEASPSRPLRLQDSEVQRVELRVSAAGRRVAGRVSLSGDRGAEGAVVAWFPQASARAAVAPSYGRCDATGRFDLGAIRRGDGTLFVLREGSACAWRRARGAAPSDQLAIRLAEGERITGVVRDPLGRPVEGASVMVMSAPIGQEQLDGSLRNRITRSDASGRYTLEHLGVGRVVVFALHGPRGLRSKRFVELPRTEVCDLDCVGSSFVRGRLLDVDGRGLAGYTIEGVPSHGADARMRQRWKTLCKTKDDGSFALQLARKKSYRVAVFAPGFERTDPRRQPCLVRESVRSGPELELRVAARDPGTALSGQLTRTARRRGARVTLESVVWDGESEVPVLANGRFRVAGLPSGRYRVYVAHPGFGRREVADFVLRAAQHRALGRIDLMPPSSILVRSDQVDLRGASVLVRDQHGSFVLRRLVAASGRLRLSRLAPGQYSVLVSPKGCEPYRAQLRVQAGMEGHVSVHGVPGTPCTIALDYHAVGMPFFRKGPVHLRLTDERGRRVFEDIVRPDDHDLVHAHCSLPRGAYRMEATCLGGRSIARDIEVGRDPLRVAASMH